MTAELSAEDQAWKDAYYIAWVGACNPLAVAGTLTRNTSALMGELHDTNAIRHHPALIAIAGQLGYLYDVSFGPSEDILDAVKANAERLGITGTFDGR